jgi:hypothetical protein
MGQNDVNYERLLLAQMIGQEVVIICVISVHANEFLYNCFN